MKHFPSETRLNLRFSSQPPRTEEPMPKQKTIRILQTDLLEHPAVKAWGELRPERVEPEQIEILKQKTKGAVYRLAGVGPGNSAIIAKRARQAKAVIERTIYEEVLPHLPVTTLHYYGCIEEEDGRFWWLFLEDVGEQRYSPSVEEHRALAARWFGEMHTSAERVGLKANLPDRGPNLYLTYLRSARELIPQIRPITSLSVDDMAVLINIVSICVFLEAHWSQVETFCDRMPRTFVHDDCLAKNVHVRTTQAGLTIAPIDWGGAGWGLPATDLGQLRLPYRGQPPANPDIATYQSIVRDQWPSLDAQTIQQLANLGQMFWSLKVISRAVPEFDYEWAHIEHVMYNFRIYEAALADSIRLARWEN
jgi:thiamine kinase-like enzyme